LALIALAFNLLGAVVWVGTTIAAGDNLVRLRNALGARVGEPADFRWLPDGPPPGFLTARESAPTSLVRAADDVSEIAGALNGKEFSAGVAFARHLMSASKRVDGAINATSDKTYSAIVHEGRGYCADFVKAFTGLAVARGIAVRQWGFAFNGFGSGHTFNEVFDAELNKWVMIDSFHSLYFVDPVSRLPLSVLEVHDRLLTIEGAEGGVVLVRILPDAVPFRSDALALDYYRRGMPQLWLVWGNNLFDYEKSVAGFLEQHWHRAVGQLVGLVTGTYPGIRIYPVGLSSRDFRLLVNGRNAALASLGFLVLSVVLAIYVLFRQIQHKRLADQRVSLKSSPPC
jgi:hypothetical protein